MSQASKIAIVGGGLAGSLLAYRIHDLFPEQELLLIEGGPHLGGNHTWSAHRSDFDSQSWKWLKPLIDTSWDGYQVSFENFRRKISLPYFSIEAASFAKKTEAALGHRVRLCTTVSKIESHELVFEDGSRIGYDLLIDARGWTPTKVSDECGYQKFVGLEVSLDDEHGLTGPILMDANCEQLDGFRFFYVLPLAPTRVLIEDTYYSNQAQLDLPSIELRIRNWAGARGWKINSVLRTETGVLPIPLHGSAHSINHSEFGIPFGVRRKEFHSTTGYSLPWAIKQVEAFVGLGPKRWNPVEIERALDQATFEMNRRRGYHTLLNRMLFEGATPSDRWKIFRRFYGMSEGLIERFYSGRLTTRDQVRILVGRPPIPITRAAKIGWNSLFSSGAPYEAG